MAPAQPSSTPTKTNHKDNDISKDIAEVLIHAQQKQGGEDSEEERVATQRRREEDRTDYDTPQETTKTRKSQMRHEQARIRSYENLRRARDDAEIRGEVHENARDEMVKHTTLKFKRPPREWQVDVGEAVYLQLDSVVIAGTGQGKTLPFVMPLMLHKEKCVVVISPLIALMEDQVERFSQMDLPAVAVHKDSWTKELQTDIEANKYKVILASPEISLDNARFRAMLSSEKFSKKVVAYIVDECHCISQWGGDFRPRYRDLRELRAFVSKDIPILATSATLPPDALDDTRQTLGIDPESSFFLNLGNHRSNLHFSAHEMKGSNDLNALSQFFSDQIKSALDIIKTVIFVDDRMKTQDVCARIREWLPPEFQDKVAYLNALMSLESKREVMDEFRKGNIRVLVTTEASGMGCDIPDIERVIQHGVPESLSVWMQRAGRAGRSIDIHAQAILLYEASIFKVRNRKAKDTTNQKKRSASKKQSNSEPEHTEDEDTNENGVENSVDAVTYQKTIEPSMRAWIETTTCRNSVADTFFDNPPRVLQKERSIGDCCDNCDKDITNAQQTDTSTSDPNLSVQPGTDPSRKRPNEQDDPEVLDKRKTKKPRVQVVQAQVVAALNNWRLEQKRSRYRNCSFAATGVLPNSVVKKLSANTDIETVDDLLEFCGGVWAFAADHGAEVIDIVKRLDVAHEEELRVRNEEKKKKTAVERARREYEQQVKQAIERARRDQQKTFARAQRGHTTRGRALKTSSLVTSVPHNLPSTPLAGSFTFNVAANTRTPTNTAISTSLADSNDGADMPASPTPVRHSNTRDYSAGHRAYANIFIPWSAPPPTRQPPTPIPTQYVQPVQQPSSPFPVAFAYYQPSPLDNVPSLTKGT